jgi:uncharacterized protein
VRTCIGCRQRSPATALLRVVVMPGAAGGAVHIPSDDVGGAVALPVVPDPRRRLPGRGAWLHPDPDCVSLAQRRRAFARALRVPDVDPTPVLETVARTARTKDLHSTSGTPQEMTSNGHSMKRQR